MKAPNKLFLHPNHRDEVGANWLIFPLTEKDECYLRKDTLLEWAKEKAEDYKGTANIRRSFEMMIRKIESL